MYCTCFGITLSSISPKESFIFCQMNRRGYGKKTERFQVYYFLEKTNIPISKRYVEYNINTGFDTPSVTHTADILDNDNNIKNWI